MKKPDNGNESGEQTSSAVLREGPDNNRASSLDQPKGTTAGSNEDEEAMVEQLKETEEAESMQDKSQLDDLVSTVENVQQGPDPAVATDLADQSIPILFYSRVLNHALPRTSRDEEDSSTNAPFQFQCTCSVMGRILLSPENVAGPTSLANEDETPVMTLLQQYLPHLGSSNPGQPIELFVSIMGFADGAILVFDAKTQSLVCSNQMQIRENGKRHPVVALSMDSSGTFLAAIDAGGMCSIFEFTKFQIHLASPVDSTSAEISGNDASPSGADSNVFSGFMSVFTGSSQAATTQTGRAASGPGYPMLVVSSLQTHRISYPRNFGMPTTVAIDPAYKRRREKAVLVGFADGRLVQTKRGLIFQRRNDAVLHQAVPASPADSSMAPGIQSLVWRAGLVAWAEPSGIRLYDADALAKIAHVDRPVGARPSLYPSVKGMTARLCFETSDRLLVVWGDCLLQLTIRDSSASGVPTTTAVEGADGGNPVTVRRRTVECTMAWELDCIAVDVAPLDTAHVMVLGLVPSIDEENNNGDRYEEPKNEVELQVISRENGNVVYSDLIPVLKGSPEGRGRRNPKPAAESILPYTLLSSFNIARMDDTTEGMIDETLNVDFDPTSLFAGTTTRRRFRDSHLRWDVSHVSPAPNDCGDGVTENFSEDVDGDEESMGSVDSDDYSFVFHPQDIEPGPSSGASPPVLWVVSSNDSIYSRVRSIDDVVSALTHRPALALQRALHRRADLRRHTLDELVNSYFVALLRRSSADNKRLSLRRMKIAAAAMPTLIGGNIELWQNWISQLEKLPGALFILRNVIPVRDPVLPSKNYTSILEKMYEQVIQMKDSSEMTTIMEKLVGEAENHFLYTLLGWGTSHGIREHLNYYKSLYAMSRAYKAPLIAIEGMARRRTQQSSASYLSFPAELIEVPHEPADVHYQVPTTTDELHDSLYNTDELIAFLEASLRNSQGSNGHGSKVALDALSKIMIGRGQYDAALKYLLLLGSEHSDLSLEAIESKAVQAVEDTHERPLAKAGNPYAHVLSLIETKHLHQLLLEKSFLAGERPVTPIIALIQLVGIELVGKFLVEHCVPVQSDLRRTEGRKEERRGTLPLDVVASQLEASPKILYWYLDCIFKGKAEVYVKFPNTANPPMAVTQLHRKALDLYIKYAGKQRDSISVLNGVEAYRVGEISTPLLSFLKAILQLGTINPLEVGKQLQIQRQGGAGVSSIFALELAFVLDRYGEQDRENANMILELYLHGSKSLMLAVSFAQRSTVYKAELWETLVDYCLSSDEKGSKRGRNGASNHFGALLEAAALSGADLAQLVTKIPPGMSIEGLRPRLVAAVSDYRFKQQMHLQANEIAEKEASQIFRECEHKTRRGRRYEASSRIKVPAWALASGSGPSRPEESQTRNASVSTLQLKPKIRPQRFSLAYSLPAR